MRPSSVCAAVAVLCLFALPLPLKAQWAPRREPLPRIDARQASRPARASFDSSPSGPRTQAEKDLRRRYPDLTVHWDSVTGTPRSVYSLQGFLTPENKQTGDPVEVVRGFLRTNQDFFGITAADLDTLAPSRRSRVEGSPVLRRLTQPVHFVALDQRWKGRHVYPASLVGAVTSKGQLVSLAGEIVPDLASTINTEEPRLTAREALARASESVGVPFVPSRHPRIQSPKGPEQRQTFAAGGAFGADVPVRLLYLAVSRESARLAWEATLGKADDLYLYQVLVDAETGEILFRVSLTDFDTPRWRVFAQALATPATDPRDHIRLRDSPAPFSPGPPTPTGLQGTPVAPEIVTTNGLPAASPQGWIPDGTTTTTGNNVIAWVNLTSDGMATPDEQPDATLVPIDGVPTRTFDFPSDLAAAPTTAANRDAAVTHFFFVANWFHDRAFQLGFDEAAGNFQEVNFTGAGVAGDPQKALIVEIADSNGSASTPAADGTCCPTLALRFFGGPTPDRNTALDQDVLVHELTHGMTSRLIAGPNVDGIDNYPGIAIAEGYSDWYALALLSTIEDTPASVRAFAAWVTRSLFEGEELFPGTPFTFSYQDNYTYGIRRFPYTTDQTRSPLTFIDVNPSTYDAGGVPRSPFWDAYDAHLIEHSPLHHAVPSDEPHHIGEIWALALWEVRARLIADLGFAEGSELALQLVTDSLSLQPQDPTFLEARDALLLADLARTGGANLCRIWEALAIRGFGAGAWVPAYDAETWDGLTESFTPQSFAACRPLLDFALVLDFSGSMNGVEACDAPPHDVKITVLKQAVPALLNAWEPFAVPGDRVGIMNFDTDANPLSTPFLRDFLTHKAAILADVAARPTGSMTALGPATLLAAKSFDNRVRDRHMVVLTDGMQNVNPQIVAAGDPDGDGVTEHHVVNAPSAFFTSPTVPGEPGRLLQSFGIPMHTLSVGAAPGSVYDELLADVSEETGGLHQHTCVPQVDLESFLTNSLVEALKGHTVELVGYETGTLGADSAPGEHRFPINGSATRAAFLLSWSGGSGKPGDLVLKVFTPDGTEVASESFKAHGSSFERVAVPFPLFLDSSGPAAFVGDWKVVVQRKAPGSGPILYRTYLLVDDAALEYDLSIRPSVVNAGEAIPLRVRVTEKGQALRPKTVRATVRRPRISAGNLIRQSKVTDADRARIVRELRNREILISPLTQTWEAAFRDPKNAQILQPLVEELELFDDGRPEHGDERAGDGTYSARIVDTQVPGEYEVRFDVAGDSKLHGPFRRTKTASATVVVREASRTEVETRIVKRGWWWRPDVVRLTLTPRDRFGSYLGPGYADRIQASLPDGKAAGSVVDRLDGTYTQDFRVRRSACGGEIRIFDTRIPVPAAW